MNNIKLNLGGELQPGDVVGVSYSNWNAFGWYVGVGKTGSMHFIRTNVPSVIKTQYDNFISGKENNAWAAKNFLKGLRLKLSQRIISFWLIPKELLKSQIQKSFSKTLVLQRTTKYQKNCYKHLNFQQNENTRNKVWRGFADRRFHRSGK
jgi:hypothetical protein